MTSSRHFAFKASFASLAARAEPRHHHDPSDIAASAPSSRKATRQGAFGAAALSPRLAAAATHIKACSHSDARTAAAKTSEEGHSCLKAKAFCQQLAAQHAEIKELMLVASWAREACRGRGAKRLGADHCQRARPPPVATGSPSRRQQALCSARWYCLSVSAAQARPPSFSAPSAPPSPHRAPAPGARQRPEPWRAAPRRSSPRPAQGPRATAPTPIG